MSLSGPLLALFSSLHPLYLSLYPLYSYLHPLHSLFIPPSSRLSLFIAPSTRAFRCWVRLSISTSNPCSLGDARTFSGSQLRSPANDKELQVDIEESCEWLLAPMDGFQDGYVVVVVWHSTS